MVKCEPALLTCWVKFCMNSVSLVGSNAEAAIWTDVGRTAYGSVDVGQEVGRRAPEHWAGTKN